MRQVEKDKDQYFQTAINLDIFYIEGKIPFYHFQALTGG